MNALPLSRYLSWSPECRACTAAHQRGVAQRLDVDDRERAADVLQVKRLDQAQAVERDVQLVGRCATHGEACREVRCGHAGQAVDGAIDVLADLWHRLELFARQCL